jgi:hypothetical protein
MQRADRLHRVREQATTHKIGTAILFKEILKGGTRLTRNLCALEKKPYILIRAQETSDPTDAAKAILKFVEDNGIEVLNVAGPRASGWAEGYRFAVDVISCAIAGSPHFLCNNWR